MTILVLKPSGEYSNYFSLNKFDNKEQAIEFIKDNCYDDLREFKMFEADELELNLRIKEVNNE